MIIFIWFILILTTVIFIIAVINKWSYIIQGINYCLFLVAALALFPVVNLLSTETVAPTQIVYRFDDHRYIQLTGYRCEGRAYFIDEKEKIYYELAAHSWDLFTGPFIHPSKNYISIPLSDLSAISISTNGGRTFRMAHFYSISKRPKPNEVENYSVINGRTYVLTKTGELYVTEDTFGSKSNWLYSKNDEDDSEIIARNNIVPEHIPPIADDYSGWDRMRCNYSAKGMDLPKSRTPLQVYHTWLGIDKPKELAQ